MILLSPICSQVIHIYTLLLHWNKLAIFWEVKYLWGKLGLSFLECIYFSRTFITYLSWRGLVCPVSIRPKSSFWNIFIIGYLWSTTICCSKYVWLEIWVFHVFTILILSLSLFNWWVWMCLLSVLPVCPLTHQCTILFLINSILLSTNPIQFLILSLFCSLVSPHRLPLLVRTLGLLWSKVYLCTRLVAIVNSLSTK